MSKILIAGDSYAADWGGTTEWWKSLPHDVINIAQAGSSQYRILKSLPDKNVYDITIIFHTSPYRIFTENNVIHNNSTTHKHSDYLIYDIISKGGKVAKAMKTYVEYLYNEEFILYTHTKICEDIIAKVKNKKVIHVTAFDYTCIHTFDNVELVDIRDIASDHQGDICHLSEYGNKLLAEKISEKINLTI